MRFSATFFLATKFVKNTLFFGVTSHSAESSDMATGLNSLGKVSHTSRVETCGLTSAGHQHCHTTEPRFLPAGRLTHNSTSCTDAQHNTKKVTATVVMLLAILASYSRNPWPHLQVPAPVYSGPTD